jgi:hypothetical protein
MDKSESLFEECVNLLLQKGDTFINNFSQYDKEHKRGLKDQPSSILIRTFTTFVRNKLREQRPKNTKTDQIEFLERVLGKLPNFLQGGLNQAKIDWVRHKVSQFSGNPELMAKIKKEMPTFLPIEEFPCTFPVFPIAADKLIPVTLFFGRNNQTLVKSEDTKGPFGIHPVSIAPNANTSFGNDMECLGECKRKSGVSTEEQTLGNESWHQKKYRSEILK